MANLFISHRGEDIAPAERLAKALRDAGHAVWLDKWEIRVGDSIIAKMNDGLQGATHLLLCYSDAGVLAPWINREWMAALGSQLAGRDIRVLPVRLTGGESPAILADIRYADLVSSWDTGLADLLLALQ